ncbi:hypothetical protein HDU96_010664, partial [Phlyctochytrium bullatum]
MFKDLSVTTTVLAVAAVIAAIPVGMAAIMHINTRRPKVKGLPFPKPAPIMGNTYYMMADINGRYDIVTKWFKELGSTFVFLHMSLSPIKSNVILTADPAVIQHILKTNFENYIKGTLLHEPMEPLLGDGIFVTDGEQWKWQRKVSSHIFTGRNFREVVEKVVVEEMEKFLGVLSATAESGKQIDLHALLHSLTMDSFGQIGFGQRLNTLDDPTNPPAFVRSFDEVTPLINMRFINDLYPISEALSGDGAKIRKGIKVIEDVVYEQIRRKREEHKKRRENGETEGAKKRHSDLLDLFIAYDDEITDRQLRDMVLNMILAGRDTTAQALSWAIWILSSRPDVVAKMREEIARTVGDALPSYDECPTMKYITAVFYETLRLYPSVPWNSKRAVKD